MDRELFSHKGLCAVQALPPIPQGQKDVTQATARIVGRSIPNGHGVFVASDWSLVPVQSQGWKTEHRGVQLIFLPNRIHRSAQKSKLGALSEVFGEQTSPGDVRAGSQRLPIHTHRCTRAMNISLNLMSLVIGVVAGAVPVLGIMYFRLKYFAARIQHADALHRSEVAASAQLTKLSEDNYLKKIASLEDAIQKIESSAGSASDVLKVQLEVSEERRKEEVRAIRDELKIEAFPYQYEEGTDGWVSDDRYAEIGYKYILFVRGMPCFSAHEIPIKKLKKKEVSREKVIAAAEEVAMLLASIATRHKSFVVTSKPTA